jgi:hypothetical protein
MKLLRNRIVAFVLAVGLTGCSVTRDPESKKVTIRPHPMETIRKHLIGSWRFA